MDPFFSEVRLRPARRRAPSTIILRKFRRATCRRYDAGRVTCASGQLGGRTKPSRLKSLILQWQSRISLESRLKVTTQQRHVSSLPTRSVELRCKNAMLSNRWLLAQMRQPARPARCMPISTNAHSLNSSTNEWRGACRASVVTLPQQRIGFAIFQHAGALWRSSRLPRASFVPLIKRVLKDAMRELQVADSMEPQRCRSVTGPLHFSCS